MTLFFCSRRRKEVAEVTGIFRYSRDKKGLVAMRRLLVSAICGTILVSLCRCGVGAGKLSSVVCRPSSAPRPMQDDLP
jgi:hypothetical protein